MDRLALIGNGIVYKPADTHNGIYQVINPANSFQRRPKTEYIDIDKTYHTTATQIR